MTCKQDIKLLLRTVADYFNLAAEELISKRKDKKTTLARHVAIYLMREGYNCSLADISKELGNNKTTVLRGYEKIAKEMNINHELRDKILEIKEKIGLHKGCKNPL